jgi:hypothetical protein
MDLVNNLEKNQKLHIQVVAVTLKLTSCRAMSEKKMKKNGKPRFYGQNNLFFESSALQPLGSFSHMVVCRKIQEK